MTERLLTTLKKYWGYDSFRALQQQAIESVLNDRDTIVLLPTGGGKSILYQLPTLHREGLCIVITPLISLMKDQVDRLRKLSVNAIAVHSGLTPRQIDYALDNCAYGNVKFLYVAPERLSSESFRMRLPKMNVTLVAVDEAHCISQWGYDFRPSYLKIAAIRLILRDVPVIALTASATPKVVADIADKLGMDSPVILQQSFARKNLSYIIRHCEDRLGQLLRIAERVEGCGIVYVRMRDTAEKLARELAEHGVSADCYHGGMTHPIRTIKQEAWTSGRCRVMVATNAFGMGIDKADVRFVVHWDICDSIEAYYQEAGRAGRDGLRSYAMLMISPDDKPRAMKRFEMEFPPIEKIKQVYEAICNYLQVGYGDGKFASFTFNLFEFSQRHKIFGATALNAIKVLQQNGYLNYTDELHNPPRILFTVSRDDLYRVRIDNNQYDHVLRVILRLYTGLFNDFTPIDESEIAATAGYTVEHVKELMKGLWQLRVIKYIPSNYMPLLMLTEERLTLDNLHISHESYAMRKDSAKERLEGMFRYADNVTECRSKVIGNYFGETTAEDCGICDICLMRRKAEQKDIRQCVLDALKNGALGVRELVNAIDAEPQPVIKIIDRMLETEEIFADKMGRINIKE